MKKTRDELREDIRDIVDCALGRLGHPKPDYRSFIMHLLEDHWEGDCSGVEIPGEDFQELAEMYHILIPVLVKEPCHEGCFCSCYNNIPGTCYRPHPDLDK